MMEMRGLRIPSPIWPGCTGKNPGTVEQLINGVNTLRAKSFTLSNTGAQ